MNPLVAWVRERESIRKKKEGGEPAPWTSDPILQKYRFTNVRRRDDRVSKWLIENVLLEKYIDYDLDSFLMFSALCRWVNWPPTLKALMEAGHFPNKNPDYKAIGKFIDKRHKTGEKTWTGAYLIRAKPGSNKGKGNFVAVEVVGKPVRQALPSIKSALATQFRRNVWKAFYDCSNWGPFTAGQVTDDLSWTKLLVDAQDTYTWAPQGPGSLRGFNRLVGLPLKTKHSEEEWCSTLQMWRDYLIWELGKEYDDVSLADIQSGLCETDKYLRVKNREGRPRSNYKPETAF